MRPLLEERHPRLAFFSRGSPENLVEAARQERRRHAGEGMKEAEEGGRGGGGATGVAGGSACA